MNLAKCLALSWALASPTFAHTLPSVRRLQEAEPGCGELSGCALADITNWLVVASLQSETVEYTIDPDVDYSIACFVANGSVDKIQIAYGNGDNVVEDKEPYWVGGDIDGVPIPVAYLKTPGDKVFDVVGTLGGQVCFDHVQTLLASGATATDATPYPTTIPTASPTASPTTSPTDAPTKSPTDHPTGTPTVGPTASPTKSPTSSPTDGPTRSPTGGPSASPTKSPTGSPTEGPTISPTAFPTTSPTESPVVICPNFQCPLHASPKKNIFCVRDIYDCECDSDFELEQGTCVAIERPPQPANCYLWTRKFLFYGYNADIPFGATVEAETSSGERLSYVTSGGSTVQTPDYLQYGKSAFKIRFVFQNGVAGDWKGCTNYFGTSTMMPASARCYLWSNRLYFGRYTFVPSGYRVEARTVVGKRFHYNSIGRNFVYANDFRSYDSQPFELRFLKDGVPGPWRSCVNYTPIALDLDQSGAVEHITGEFVIDITADGNPETLEEWFAPTEGILVDTMLGTKHSIHDVGGVITGHHLFGDMGKTYVDGYEKLALLDANDDGYVSGDELDGLAIWTDANSNALLDDGELSSLQSHNVVSLSVVHDHFISEAILADGSTMLTEDKWFKR